MRQSEAEQLRQERETFDILKRQSTEWFKLRLMIGYVCLTLFLIVASCCAAVIFNHDAYSPGATLGANAMLFADILGMAWTILKIVMTPANISQLKPVTQVQARKLENKG